MPHKHTRKRDANTESHYDLAPSNIATPLPAFAAKVKPKIQKSQAKRTEKKPSKAQQQQGNGSYKYDDTPRAFTQMMQWAEGKKRSSGLDDGERDKKSKKRKLEQDGAVAAQGTTSSQAKEFPKLLPGERLADYNARVDQAMPVAGLARKGKGPKIEGLKERQTRTEKRLHKLYAAWREEDARIKEQLEEQRELEEEAEDERRAMYGSDYLSLDGRSRKKRKIVGETGDVDDEDPWAQLKASRDKPRGLHDVVEAPPDLQVVPKEKFKVRNNAKVDVANVPAAAGSLKRREELSNARREVIAQYRAMMKGKSGL